jgi:hypothetical protein
MASPNLAEIKTLLDATQVSLDAEQARVSELLAEKDTTIATLNQTIADLIAQQADGGTPEERQAVIDSLTALKTDLEGTVE